MGLQPEPGIDRGRQITVPQPPEPRCRGRRPTAMMDIPSAAGPDRRRIVYLLAALAGVAAGLAVGLAARPTARWIPADARVVTVTPVFGMSPASTLPHPASWEKPGLRREEFYFSREEKFDHAFTITDPATVARIAAVINGFDPVGPGTYNCPASTSDSTMQLTFRTSSWRPGRRQRDRRGPGLPVGMGHHRRAHLARAVSIHHLRTADAATDPDHREGQLAVPAEIAATNRRGEESAAATQKLL